MNTARSLLFGLALLAPAPLPASGQEPVLLRLAEAPRLDGRAWVITLAQEITFGGEHGGTQILRDARLRVHFEAGEAGGRTVVVVDSARASVQSPHGREVIDLRRHAGSRTQAVYGRNGGPAEWSAPEPVLGFGELGGTLPLSALVDLVFPALDGRAVRPGDAWERSWTRRQIDGNVTTTQTVTTRYRLERIDGRSGNRVAHVAFTTDVPGGPSARGSFALGVEDGLVRSVALDESVSGSWNMGGSVLPFDQATTMTATPVAGR